MFRDIHGCTFVGVNNDFPQLTKISFRILGQEAGRAGLSHLTPLLFFNSRLLKNLFCRLLRLHLTIDFSPPSTPLGKTIQEFCSYSCWKSFYKFSCSDLFRNSFNHCASCIGLQVVANQSLAKDFIIPQLSSLHLLEIPHFICLNSEFAIMSCIHLVTDCVRPTLFLFCHLQLPRLQFMSEVMCSLCESPKYSQIPSLKFLFQHLISAVLSVQNFSLWMIAPYLVLQTGSPQQFTYAVTFSYCNIQSEC